MQHLLKLATLAGFVIAVALLLATGASAVSLHEVKQLEPSNDSYGLGQSVAISDNTAIVGSPGEDFPSANSGAAYVFERDAGGAGNWDEVTRLEAQQSGSFGSSVAIDGDTAIVSSGTTTYVFERDQGGANEWDHVATLIPSDGRGASFLRPNVGISGDTAVVAGLISDSIAEYTPTVYVFGRNEGGANNWGEVARLIGSNVEPFDAFGQSVAISGDTIVVGAPDRVGGVPPTSNGVAYIFDRNLGGADSWGEVMKITGSDTEPGDVFGGGVAISGDTFLIGAYRISTHPTSCCTGAAYVFQREQGGTHNWEEVKKLTAADGYPGRFGGSVAINGDTALVGASAADAFGINSGLAYTFRRDHGGENNWGQVNRLAASNVADHDAFASSVAVSGSIGIVGAPGAAGGPLHGCCGSAYVFELLSSKAALTGDSDCSGVLDVRDAAIVLQASAGLITRAPCHEDADVNRDGDITTIDAALVLQFAAVLLSTLPP